MSVIPTPFRAALLAIALGMTVTTAARSSGEADMPRSGQVRAPAATQSGPIQPAEAGQAAFAALAEIVAILESDPDTDWGRVDIGALRRHLVDMDLLVLQASAVEEDIPGGLQILVSGAGAVEGAIRRMVPAHAGELDRIPGWTARAVPDDAGLLLQVIAERPEQTARIRGLGFYGLLATGSHHQAHHLAIARGQGMGGHGSGHGSGHGTGHGASHGMGGHDANRHSGAGSD